jgi:hypothetical protein
MNKRGVALIFGSLVMVVLLILVSTFFFTSINENNSARKYVNSVLAFWVAEAGVAEAIKALPNSPTNGNLGSYSYQTTTTYRTTINATDYYDIVSTGIVALPSGGDIRRTVNAVVKRGSNDPTKFKYAIAAANDLCFGGASCNKDPNDFLDPDICNGGPCWEENDTTINFRDLFGYDQSEVSAIATHYTDANFPDTVSGVTWVDVTPGNTLMVTGTETGTGMLIINGNVHFGGSYQFHGIIYVLGILVARGTFDAYGSVIVASNAGVDSINGNPEFHWDQSEIDTSLDTLSNHFKQIVSWRETETP